MTEQNNELIKVTVKNDTQLVSARELHRGLDITRKFSNWIKDSVTDFVEGEDYTREPESYLVKSGNGTERKYDDYALTLDMAKELAMVSHSENSKEYRKYFLQLEKDWNDPAKVIERGYHYLQDENYTLKIENNSLHSENNKLKVDNQLMEPKAKVFDDLVDKGSATSFTDTAKQIGLQPRKFTQWLRDNKYIYYDKKHVNIPYQQYTGTYFVVRETKAGYTQTLVTEQGKSFFDTLFDMKNAVALP